MVDLTIEQVFSFFIKKISSKSIAISSGECLTESRLHALVAYAYVWHLGLRDKKLFDANIYASRNGNGYFFYSQRQKFADILEPYPCGRTEFSSMTKFLEIMEIFAPKRRLEDG